jgi:hypothetical protein
MYYAGEFLQRASPGDLLILARSTAGDLHALVLEAASSWLRSAVVLFNLEIDQPAKFVLADSRELDRRKIEFVSERIIDELELSVELPATKDFEGLARTELAAAIATGLPFPSTSRMADLARANTAIESRNADALLLEWLETEERIFRAIEQLIVQVKLRDGFSSVDDFIAYSLSVQNRRKSRMGFALQNHLAEVFRMNQIRFTAQAFTENRKKPDFLFPGADEYHDRTFEVGNRNFGRTDGGDDTKRRHPGAAFNVTRDLLALTAKQSHDAARFHRSCQGDGTDLKRFTYGARTASGISMRGSSTDRRNGNAIGGSSFNPRADSRQFWISCFAAMRSSLMRTTPLNCSDLFCSRYGRAWRGW